MRRFALVCILSVTPLAVSPLHADDDTASRTQAGLLALYDFQEAEGAIVHDRAGEPINLRITDPQAVTRRDGALEVRQSTRIISDGPAAKINRAVKESGAITIEAWVHPAGTDQSGPARIVSLSKSPNERNITLGQDGNRYDVRLRTTGTSTNGIPSLPGNSGSVTTQLTHVVYTYERDGRTRIYVNGKLESEKRTDGDTRNWDDGFQLVLANEATGDRLWLGSIHLIAIYGRSLSPGEVEQNFRAGARGTAAPQPLAATRTTSGLQALYDFQESGGAVVEDRSGAGEPVNLEIADADAVRRSDGALEIRAPTLIASQQPPQRIIDAVSRTGELTLEAWIRPASTDQQGPARILTLSKDSGQRNFTLGQDGGRYDVRLRTSGTSTNGIPSVATNGGVKTNLTHVVYTHDRAGRTRIYLDGAVAADETISGELGNWDGSFRLALANELSRDRPWLGTYHLVAIYSRSLRPDEVELHFRAGPSSDAQLAQSGPDTFEKRIAPLLAQHCLECHDSATHEGGLDLSRKEAALAGGDSGELFVPKQPGESLLWELVSSDEMPKERPPLSDEQKELLREWIGAGGDWSLAVIDPTIYGRQVEGNWLRRLTISEYIATVRSAVGVDISEDARRLLPPDLRADGFSNTAYNLGVDLEHVEAYAQLAEIIVSKMDVLEFAGRYEKQRLVEDDNMRKLISEMGKWIYRGPLEEHEVVTLRGIGSTVVSAGGDFKEAVGYILQAMLQSPRFLYRIENQRGDGTAWPVSDYELAARLSYIIWGAPPDRELMRAAEAGEFYDRAALERQIDRLLADPRAIDRSLEFASEWLNLGRLRNMRPNGERFPDWSDDLADDMREETLAFFREVVWEQKRPLADLLNAQVTFATPRLARHYGLEPQGEGLKRYDLSNVPARGGLLSQGSVLTVGGDEASMVSRGLFVLHDFLRGAVKAPPPCVDTTPVPTMEGLTQRGIAEARIADANCGGCHGKFEPLAFGLEKFDGIGRFHDRDEHGNVLREDGEVLIPGAAEPAKYATTAELMNLLAGADRVKQCLTWKVTQFALGRPLGAADARQLAEIHETSQAAGGTYPAAIKAIVTSDLVRMTRTEAPGQ